jgi:hypothetical protein
VLAASKISFPWIFLHVFFLYLPHKYTDRSFFAIKLSPKYDFNHETQKTEIFNHPTIETVYIWPSRAVSLQFSLTWTTCGSGTNLLASTSPSLLFCLSLSALFPLPCCHHHKPPPLMCHLFLRLYCYNHKNVSGQCEPRCKEAVQTDLGE